MKSIRFALGAALLTFSSLVLSFNPDACAEAAKAIKEATSTNGFILAKVAHECLISVPFHKDDATTTLQQMRLFLQFYSAQTYFAHPPTDKLELRPVDMNKTLDNIESNIKDGKYLNEYSFNKDLFDLFGSYRDGHVMYLPLCYTAFSYIHNYPLVSIAKTPDSIPEVYVATYTATTSSFIAGDKVVKINGQDVIGYLTDKSHTHPELTWIDPDARWNQLMAHLDNGKPFYGLFAERSSYEDLTITWENSSTTTVTWYAKFMGEHTFNSTDNFYSNVCVRSAEEIKKVRTSHTRKTTVTKKKGSEPSSGHPLGKRRHDSTRYKHVESTPDGILGLYVLDDQVGVLQITTFEPAEDRFVGFSVFISKAIAHLQEKGIKRIVIDLTGNGGGRVYLGLDAATQFFPTADHFFGTNMRWNHALEAMLTKGEGLNGTYWDLGHTHRMDGSDFSSYQELLGPVYRDGDYFTEISRPDLAEANSELYTPLPPVKTGPQPFDTENIILLSSGMCGSTCAIFAEAMVEQGVRSVVFGGRPQEGSMQTVGGVKGSQVLEFDEIAGWAYYFLGDDVYKYDSIPNITTVATLDARINLRNSWRKDNQDIPIEFIYTPAEYRLSYTKDMLTDFGAMWEAARDVAWQGAKHFKNGTNNDATNVVEGSTASKSKNKSDVIDGEGVDNDESGAMPRKSIGQLIWQKIGGHG